MSYLDTDSLFFMVDFNPNVVTLGKIPVTGVPFDFQLYNHSSTNLLIDSVVSQADYFNIEFHNNLESGKSIRFNAKPTKNYPLGIFSTTISIYVHTYKVPLKITVLGETKE